MLNQFQIAGLLTHLLVFALGVGGLTGIVPLARGRRAGVGLILMAIAMSIVVLEPILHWGMVAVVVYVTGFLTGLWLLLGPKWRE